MQTTNTESIITIELLADMPIWLCWREELNNQGKLTKRPYQPTSRYPADFNNADQRTTREIAEAGAARLRQDNTAN